MTSHEDSVARLEIDDEPPRRYTLPPSRGDAPAFMTLGILAILVCVGLIFEAPGFLVVLLIVATPALIRTAVTSSRQRRVGKPRSELEVVGTFLSSLGLVAMVGLASGAAFFATCFAVCLGGLGVSELNQSKSIEWIMVASVGAGLVPGLALAVFLFRRFWTRKG